MAIVKSGLRSLYLLSAVTFGLQLLIWVAADKSGFRPLTEKIFASQMFLKILEISKENTCFGASF